MLLLTSEVQHVNHIDRSFAGNRARWRGLGILSLARLARSQDQRVAMLLEPIFAPFMRSSNPGIDRRIVFQVFPKLSQLT